MNNPNIDTKKEYITIYNPEQIKYYINVERLYVHRLDVNKNTNKAYVTFRKDDDTFRAYKHWIAKCKQYKEIAEA